MIELNEFHEGDNIGGLATIETAHITDFISTNPIVFKPDKIWRGINFHPN